MTIPSGSEPESAQHRAAAGGPSPFVPSERRPGQVLAAAAVGFVVGFFVLMNALVLVGAVRLLGPVSAVFGAVYLALAGACVWGSVKAVTGRGGRLLTVAGALTGGLGVLGLGTSLAQGAVNIWSVLLAAAGTGIVLLLLQSSSREYFAARGAK
ncbi:hypothetical protein [Geodermatophilus sabuli]|uniref:Uncharacterized protein n=1 Tax=Geodermatophilus sabuli TaxID=1564158 RepID=A0A285EIH4_9ACTN|nr:hypothetical protein [Geodermatophilus sabuli]MBB3085867.1 hypothetical protein [Geodermatophilus sabuli]SNX98922.1 hypothetical protein SAMN06893097_11311 [Geodermatophilus sabuli]